jgi:cell division septum initiation protein DivIVA
MSVVATGVRERSFRTVIGGFDPEAVRAALDGAATECERLDAEIALLKEQQAIAVGEIDRMSELERSLLRSCVAAEEDARIRCGAARRYAARMIAAAEEQAAARLEAPGHERDRITREIDAIHEKRRQAAKAIESLIADLQRPAEPGVREDAGQFEIREAALADRAPGTTASTGAAPSHQTSLDAPAPPRHASEPETGRSSVVTDGVLARSAATDAKTSPAAQVGDAATDTGADDFGKRPVPQRADREQPLAPEIRRGNRFRLAIAAGMPAAVLLILQGSPGAPTRDTTVRTVSAAGFAPAPDPSTPRASSADAADAAVLPGAPTTAATLKIHIKPLRTCWVRVVVDDRTDARELQPGEDIALEARRSIVLRVGDAGALSIEVNGRVLPPLGLDGQVVERRFTVAAQN